MPQLSADFKSELRIKANESLKRHVERLDEEARLKPIDPPTLEMFESFTAHLHSSKRVLALLGAGLSVSSGIPTYRGAGGFWRTYSDMQLATFQAFKDDPVLVWQFYSHRRHQAILAQPNAAHFTLAELAKRVPGFLAINQNIDGLCKRAGHPLDQIIDLHGSLFNVKCTDPDCGYEAENLQDPIVPILQLPEGFENDPLDEPPQNVDIEDLPHCPRCKVSLLRPAVVWFGESIPQSKADQVEAWLSRKTSVDSTIDAQPEDAAVDLLLVVGTSAIVYPAAAYITKARKEGARVAFFNMEVKTAGAARPEPGDWSFTGDAAELVPRAFQDFLQTS